MPTRVRLLAVGFAVLCVSAPVRGETQADFSGELELVLGDALFQGETKKDTRPLIVMLDADNGRWGRALGVALGFNNGIHYGLVRTAQVTPETIVLEIELKIAGDPWVRGGRAAYNIEVKRGTDNKLEGKHYGTFKGQTISGKATGELRLPRPIRIRDFKPFQPGEHPRLLFRKVDLPALRARLSTPLGQAYLAKAKQSKDIVSLGMLNQLAGDKTCADEAMKIVQGFKGDVDPNPPDSGHIGHQLVETSFAFDLCYDAWPEDFRKEVAGYMMAAIKDRQRRLRPGHANWDPISNYYGPEFGAAGIASLAVFGEKGPRPEESNLAIPFSVREPSARIAPVGDYKPGRGVPVARFESDKMPSEWIYVGGFKPAQGKDVLEGLGGVAVARPEVGVKVTCGDRTEEFRPVSREKDKGYFNGKIDITSAIGRIYHSTSCFFAVMDNDRPRWARLKTDLNSAEVYLAGVKLRHDDVVRLDKGLYPCLVVTPVGQTDSWGRDLVQPRLVELSDDEAAGAIADQKANLQFERALYEHDRKLWEESGGADPVIDLYTDLTRVRVYLHYRFAIGDGGFQAEGGSWYANCGARYPLVYALAHRNVFGKDVSSYPDITHLVLRRMMQVVFQDDGKQFFQYLSSGTGFDASWCTAAFPLAPDQYKPGLLWAWNWSGGLTEGTPSEKIFDAATRQTQPGELAPHLANAFTFVHYPLDMKPIHPSQGMPLSWQAPTLGFYGFRNGWQGKDEFICQVFLKALPIGGWCHNNAGTFRLLGLGHRWATVPADTMPALFRVEEPVVWLPDDKTAEGGCGQLTYLAVEKDGSCIMTIDLDDVYRAADDQRPLFDRNRIRLVDKLYGPITGFRAIALDYSGRSGAPCLMALVDRVQGARRTQWRWTVDSNMVERVRLDGTGFVLDYGDAAMNATFVTPEKPALAGGLDTEVPRVRPNNDGHFSAGPIYRIKVDGAEVYFVVLTIQRGPAPAVIIDGKGLDATVRVGSQTIRFDGHRLVLKSLDMPVL